jgi:hypothetical protein
MHLVSALAMLLLSAGGLAHAAPFQIVGPRALGMGGAHVAVAEDTQAAYWNPAAYGVYRAHTVLGQRPVPPDILDHPHHLTGPPRPDRLPPAMGMGVGGGILAREYEDILTAVNWFLDLSREWQHADLAQVRKGFRQIRDEDAVGQVRHWVDELNVEGGGLESQAHAQSVIRRHNWGIGWQRIWNLTAQPVAVADGLGLDGLNPYTIATLVDRLPDLIAQAHPWLTRNDEPVHHERWILGEPLSFHRRLARARFKTATAVPRALPVARSIIDTVWRNYETVDIGAAIYAESVHPEGAFADNDTFLRWRGATIDEFPLTVGLPLLPRLFVGANLKWMEATTYFQELRVFGREKGVGLADYDRDEGSDNDVGIDLGLLYRRPTWRAGLLARDVNSPSFDYPRSDGRSHGELILRPQVRAGVAWLPWRRLLLAADLDLTNNHSLIPHSASRIASTGLEYTPWSWLALRLGLLHDLEQDATGGSAGFGVQWAGLAVDVGAAVNFNDTKIHEDLVPDNFLLNDQTVPSDFALDAGLSYAF